ncbi:MAG: ornithine cyclodeaminase family protein [Thermomicrobiales bacterium]|nr:ornithine cyclodeaminase family protein [Thermomicrobiales bacterium]
MRFVTAAEIDAALTFPDLIEALRTAFRGDVVTPTRHHHRIDRPEGEATLLLMPAWHATTGGYAGVKVVSVVPGNAARGKPSVIGTYLLLDGDSGEPLAMLDGQALTAWRTAAASALAASCLARPDTRRMVMVGAGTLAPRLIAAHASVRPIEAVAIWNRNPERARTLAARLDCPGLRVTAIDDLAAAVAEADLVSVATMSREPLVEGAWLAPGVHLDLVGAYNPGMREADDAAVVKASVYVDTRGGALAEAGDIVQAIAAGALDEGRIAGDLFDLCRGSATGRRSADEITLFKSVGTAIEDLAAAVLVNERLAERV